MLNASAAALNFNRLSYDNYAWPGAPRPAPDKSCRPLAQRYSQVFIYFVLINARNWLRLVALAGNEGRGAAGPRMKTEGEEEGGRREHRDAGGCCAQQPERSSRSPLSRSLGQPCNFRPLLSSSLPETILRSLPRASPLFVLYAYEDIYRFLCMCKYHWIPLHAYFYLASECYEFLYISLSDMFVFIFLACWSSICEIRLHTFTECFVYLYQLHAAILRIIFVADRLKNEDENKGSWDELDC